MDNEKIPKKKQKKISFFCCSSNDKNKKKDQKPEMSIRDSDKFSHKPSSQVKEMIPENQPNLEKDSANTHTNSNNLSIKDHQQNVNNIFTQENHVNFAPQVFSKNKQINNSPQFKLPDFAINEQRNLSRRFDEVATVSDNNNKITEEKSTKLRDNVASLHKTICITEGSGQVDKRSDETKDNNFLNNLQIESNCKIRDSGQQSMANHSQLTMKDGNDFTFKKSIGENKSKSGSIFTSLSFPCDHKEQSSNIIPIEEKCNQVDKIVDETIPNEFNESAEDEFNEAEQDNKFDVHSVISSYVLTNIKMITGIKERDERSYVASVYDETEGRFPQKWDDTEFEITNENSDTIHKFIETPKSSNVNFPKGDRMPFVYPVASNSHPQLRDIYEKVNRKEKEIKRLNEKISKMISDLRKYEEENKKCERRIEKEEMEGETLRHMLNFLITKIS